MPAEGNFQRCLQLIEQLDREHGWGLAPQIQRRYVEQVITRCKPAADQDNAQLRLIFERYHKEHALIEALLDSTHPEHAEHWRRWSSQVLRIIAAKTKGSHLPDQIVSGIDDLAQEAILDIWRGLKTFSYQSSFYTWIFTVIAHCIARQYRARSTQKRAALPPAQSLEMLLMAGDTFRDQEAPTPDEVALSNMFTALVKQVLDLHPDRRLAIVFQLSIGEEQTLRAIGEQLDLSPTRVHVLLKHAVTLLRNEVVLRDWAA